MWGHIVDDVQILDYIKNFLTTKFVSKNKEKHTKIQKRKIAKGQKKKWRLGWSPVRSLFHVHKLVTHPCNIPD